MSDTAFFWLLMVGIFVAPFVVLAALSFFSHMSVNTISVDYMLFTYIFDSIKMRKVPSESLPDENPISSFKKNNSCLFYIVGPLFLTLGLLLLLTESLEQSIKPIAFLALLMILYIVSFKILPQQILVYVDGFAVDDRFYQWEKVKKVDFVLPMWDIKGLDINSDISFSKQTIRITFKGLESQVRIYPRLYKDNKTLRNLFESTVLDLGLRGTVNDRGV